MIFLLKIPIAENFFNFNSEYFKVKSVRPNFFSKFFQLNVLQNMKTDWIKKWNETTVLNFLCFNKKLSVLIRLVKDF